MTTDDLMAVLAIFFFVLFIASIALQLWCVRDLQKMKFRYEGKRALWLNIIWFAPFFGSIIYLLNRKRLQRELNIPTHRF
jgi:hypothetical protein